MSLLLQLYACVSVYICIRANILLCLGNTWQLKVKHSRTDATPLCCCLFSPMRWPVPLRRPYARRKIRFESTIMTCRPPHCILMKNNRLRLRVIVKDEQEHGSTLCWRLSEVRGMSHRSIELLTLVLIWQTPADGNVRLRERRRMLEGADEG